MTATTPTLSLEIDGRVHVLRPKEVNAFEASTFRAATGTSVEGLLSKIDTASEADLGIVEIAEFAFLAALQAGTGETFEEVAGSMSYESKFEKMTASGFADDDDDEDGFSLEPDPDEEEPDDLEGPAPADPLFGPVGSTPDGPDSLPPGDENTDPTSSSSAATSA